MTERKKQDLSKLLIIGVISAVTVFLNFTFIYTHDDLLNLGIYEPIGKIWSYCLYFGNGRLLGNFLCNFLLNKVVISNLIRALMMITVIILSPYIADKITNRNLIISALLFFGASNLIYGQVYVWAHGFYNYLPPVFTLAICLAAIKRYSEKPNKALFAIVLAFGFFGQLFSENSTIIIIVMASFTTAWAFFKKRNKLINLAFLISGTLGAIAMFLIPKIFKVDDELDYYRGFSSGIKDAITVALKNIYSIFQTLSSLWIMAIVISAAMIILMKKADSKSNKSGLFFKISFPTFISTPVFMLVNSILITNIFSGLVLHISQAICYLLICVYLLLLVVDICCLTQSELRLTLISLLAVSAISLGILLVVYPIGPRCLYFTYFLLSIFALKIVSLAKDKVNENLSKKIFVCSSAFLCAVLIFQSAIYLQINHINRIRNEYAKLQLDSHKKTVELIEIPFEKWTWCANESYAFENYYYRNEPGDTKIEMISYEEYLQKVQ